MYAKAHPLYRRPVPKDDAPDEGAPRKKKKRAAPPPSGSVALSRLQTLVRAVTLTTGLVVSTIAVMGVLSFVTTNGAGTLVVSLIIVLGIPSLVTDRLLKRYGGAGGLPFVGDVFAVTLMAIAVLFLAATPVTKHAFRRQGDRFAEGGAKGLAWATYALGGYAASFPDPATLPPGTPGASSSAAPPGGSASSVAR